jgi:immunity protein, SdpI family
MNRRTLGIASAAMVVLFLAAAVAVGSSLPADLRLPTHWGMDGRPNGFSAKWPALLMPAIMTGLLSLLFWFLPALEPRGRNFTRSTGLYLWTWAGLLLMMVATELAIVALPLHWHLRVDRLMTCALGLMFLLIGNQLGKSRSMYMVGIRTPWTLASEEVWIKTHRLGGKLMVLGGLLMVAASFLSITSGLLAGAFVAAIAVMIGVPVVYSYLLWRREKNQPSG